MKSMPRSSAAASVASASRSLTGPQSAPIPQLPKPISETSQPVFPKRLRCMSVPPPSKSSYNRMTARVSTARRAFPCRRRGDPAVAICHIAPAEAVLRVRRQRVEGTMAGTDLVKPPQLRPGARVALIAPSAVLLERDDLARGVELCRALGFEAVL